MTAEEQRLQDLAIEAGAAFSPTSPIDVRSLFAGRSEQVRMIVDAVHQRGQHVVVYGERGVGKTSLANILPSFITSPRVVVAPRINCDGIDSFDSVWRKAFEQVELTRTASVQGFDRRTEDVKESLAETLGSAAIGPDRIRRELTLLASGTLPLFIIDEFDRLPPEARRPFADLIKSLSDHAVGATIILVGVADSVEQLIEEHESIERALVQVQMPRMTSQEIQEILLKGTKQLGMTIVPAALHRIRKLSQGMPHYAHLLGLHACRAALDARRLGVSALDVNTAMQKAIKAANAPVRAAYERAVRSVRKDSLFEEVLLACSLTETNELGFFAAQDVRAPLRRVTGKHYEIPGFAQHLNEFSDAKRGPILQKVGTRRLFRYRFRNPLLQPFVIMRGIDAKMISSQELD